MSSPKRLLEIVACAAIWIAGGILRPVVAGDWPTYGHDPQRSNWASDETALSVQNVSKLQLSWKRKVNNKSFSISALTAPVIATNIASAAGPRSVLYVAGISGAVFALDAITGETLWTRTLRTMVTPRQGGLQGTFLCPNGITATPVIDKEGSVLYTISGDGSLYGLDLLSGSVKYGPVPFVAPYAKSWSLNFKAGIVYTTVSLGCGNGRSGVYAADVRDIHKSATRVALLSNGFSAGIWGRGGAVLGENGKLYGGTADGDTDPIHGNYSSTVVAVKVDDMTISDYFLPSNWSYLQKNDLDVGSASPVWIDWKERHLLAHGAKEGVVYLLDADRLGGASHGTALFTTPKLGNERETCCAGAGIWGSLSTARDAEMNTWLYVPMGGPPAAKGMTFPITHGDTPHGSMMAFRVITDAKTGGPVLDPAWISGDFDLPEPAVIANGVLFALSNGENPDQHLDESRRLLNTHPAVLRALDAATGRELFDSGAAIESWVHFSALAIADGRVYAVDHESNVYCFGLGDVQRLLTRTVVGKISSKRASGGADELSSSWVERATQQDEILKTWVMRALVTAGLAMMAAVVGLLVGIRRREFRDISMAERGSVKL